MKFLVNGTLRSEKTREDFLREIDARPMPNEAWELIRTGVVSEHGYKIGARPGFVVVIESESEEDVRALISKLPLVELGWFDLEVDPVSPFRSDLH